MYSFVRLWKQSIIMLIYIIIMHNKKKSVKWIISNDCLAILEALTTLDYMNSRDAITLVNTRDYFYKSKARLIFTFNCYSRLYMYKLVSFFIAMKTTRVACNWHKQRNKYMLNTVMNSFTEFTKHKQGWWIVLFHYTNRREKSMTIKLQLCIFKGRYQNELIVKVMFEREIYDYAFDVSKKKIEKKMIQKLSKVTCIC